MISQWKYTIVKGQGHATINFKVTEQKPEISYLWRH